MPKKFRGSPASIRSREDSLFSARETAQPLSFFAGCLLYYLARRLVGAA